MRERFNAYVWDVLERGHYHRENNQRLLAGIRYYQHRLLANFLS